MGKPGGGDSERKMAYPAWKKVHQYIQSSSKRPDDEDRQSQSECESEESEDRERAALAYLLRYEAMVRSQDAEDMATISHLKPLFSRIKLLGDKSNSDAEDTADKQKKKNVVSYSSMLDTSFTVNDTLNSNNDPHNTSRASETTVASSPCDVNDILTFACIRRSLHLLMAYNDDDSDEDNDEEEDNDGEDEEAMSTDVQLMMLLRTLVDSASYYSHIVCHSPDRSGWQEKTFDEEQEGVTFAEFVHCYKTVIGGMQALQMLPPAPTNSNDHDNNDKLTLPKNEEDEAAMHRAKTRERTLAMIRTFGPFFLSPHPTNHNHDYTLKQQHGGNNGDVSLGKSAGSVSSKHHHGNHSSALWNGSPGVSMHHQKTEDAAKTAEEMRRLLSIKDKQLVKLMEDHDHNYHDVITKHNGNGVKDDTGDGNHNSSSRSDETLGNSIYEALFLNKRRRMLLLMGTAACVLSGVGHYYYSSSDPVSANQKWKKDCCNTSLKPPQEQGASQSREIATLTQSLSASETKLQTTKADLNRAHSRIGTIILKLEERDDELDTCLVNLNDKDVKLEEVRNAWKGVVKDLEMCKKRKKKPDRNDGNDDDDGKVSLSLKHNRKLRNMVIRRQVFAAITGAAIVALAPHAGAFLGQSCWPAVMSALGTNPLIKSAAFVVAAGGGTMAGRKNWQQTRALRGTTH